MDLLHELHVGVADGSLVIIITLRCACVRGREHCRHDGVEDYARGQSPCPSVKVVYYFKIEPHQYGHNARCPFNEIDQQQDPNLQSEQNGGAEVGQPSEQLLDPDQVVLDRHFHVKGRLGEVLDDDQQREDDRD